MPQTDAGPVVTVRPVVPALSTAGAPAHPYGTSALPGLVPVLLVLPGTSGDRRCEPASNANSAASLVGLCSVKSNQRRIGRDWRPGSSTQKQSSRNAKSPQLPGL